MMKESGIEWIGVMPSLWSIKAIRYLVQDHFSGSWGNDEAHSDNDRICMRIADYDFGKMRFKELEQDSYTVRNYSNSDIYNKTLRYGDLCIEKSGGGEKTPVGRTVVYRLPYNALFANFMDCIRLKPEFYVEFAKYVFFSLYQRGETNLYYNQTTGIQNLNISKYFREVKVPVPNREIQKKIGAFLDTKCAEIDALYADIQAEIDTLEEYKKSVITEAVTKGLNPDVEMKDSGIEWVGHIPKAWNVKKIKYQLRRNELRNPGDKEVLSVYREYGVIPKDSRDDNHNVTSEDTSKYKYVKKGVLVINKMKAWQGSMGVSEYEGIVSPAYFIYEFTNKELNPRYLHYLLRNVYKDEFRRISGGIREGQWDLPSDGFENEYIPIPPHNEQIRIVEYLDSSISQIQETILLKQNQLNVLDEYKKSLIYEYVTGKKEVTNES